MNNSANKHESENRIWKSSESISGVHYDKKNCSGSKKNCLVFSLRPKTAQGRERVRINGSVED